MAEAPPPTAVLRGHASEVTAVRFGPADGAGLPLLISAAADGEVRVWNTRTHRSVASAAAHEKSVLTVHALADGKILSQGRDGAVRIWDSSSGLRAVYELGADCYSFCQCVPSPSLRLGWSSNADASGSSTVDSTGGAALPAAAAPDDAPRPASVAAGAFGSAPILATPSEDAQMILLWDLRQKGIAGVLRSDGATRTASTNLMAPRVGMCMCLRFVDPTVAGGESDVGNRATDEGGAQTDGGAAVRLLSGWEDGTLKLFDLRSDLPVASRKLHTEPLLCVAVDPKVRDI